jgi:hypothetical protein
MGKLGLLIAAASPALAVLFWAGRGGAENMVQWSMQIDDAGSSGVAVPLPAALFKDHPVPTRGTRWRCQADKVLRQDVRGNTFSALTVHCNDGETTVSSSAACLIGTHDSEKLSIELVEKTTGQRNLLRAECDG